MNQHTRSTRDETLGLWLGVLGTLCFALTLPATRLATQLGTGMQAAPALSPCFVAFGRAALAGGLSVVFLLATRSPLPRRAQVKPLALAALGNAVGYPLLLGYALRSVNANHAAVVTALLPLTTAVVAVWVLHQRARLEFWLCAVLGGALVAAFSLLRTYAQNGGFGFAWADLLLLGAVLAAAAGYVYGAQITPALGAVRVICWVCVFALPFTLPGALLLWPAQPVPVAAWGGLVYAGAVLMWTGFFAWYRALAMGGALLVSQTQLLQPFLSIVAAAMLLGEAIEALTLVFAVAVVITVMAQAKTGSAENFD